MIANVRGEKVVFNGDCGRPSFRKARLGGAVAVQFLLISFLVVVHELNLDVYVIASCTTATAVGSNEIGRGGR